MSKIRAFKAKDGIAVHNDERIIEIKGAFTKGELKKLLNKFPQERGERIEES